MSVNVAPELAAEYIVLGPIEDLQAMVEALASLPLPAPKTSSLDMSATLAVPTTRIRIWRRGDGARITEAYDGDVTVTTLLQVGDMLDRAA